MLKYHNFLGVFTGQTRTPLLKSLRTGLLVNAMKFQTYTYDFHIQTLLLSRVALPMLADSIWHFRSHWFQYGESCSTVDSYDR